MKGDRIIDEAALELAGQDEATKMALLDRFIIAFSRKALAAGFSDAQIDAQIDKIVTALAARVHEFESTSGTA